MVQQQIEGDKVSVVICGIITDNFQYSLKEFVYSLR